MKLPFAPLPENEKERMEAVLAYNLLDTPEEADFNALAELVAYICQTPIALISLMDNDRQWYKAKVGMSETEMPRKHTFCQYALHEKVVMVVPDSKLDPRFKDFPVVLNEPSIRFYAGLPLTSPEGFNIGTMCVVDHQPRQLSEEQYKALGTIANQVMAQMELRKRNHQLKLELDKSYQRELSKTKVRLETAESKIKRLYRAIEKSSATMEFDRKGFIVNVNDKLLKLLNYAKEELIGQHRSLLIPKEEQLNPDVFWEQLIQGQFYSGRIKRMGKHGDPVWLHASYTPITGAQDQVKGVLVIAQDINKEMQAEQQLLLAKDIAEKAVFAKDSFLANMSHEIRTPMNAIIGFNELLRKTQLSIEQRDYVEAMNTAGENLMVIINDILDLSKIESGKLQFEKSLFSPAETIQSVYDILKVKSREKGLRLALDLAEDLPTQLLGDGHRLYQVLVNLVGNAIKFTEVGEVLVKAVWLNDRAQSVLQVMVRDTGIGIPDDKMVLIFDRFTQADGDITRKFGGTGLGLNISKKLVELQGGSIAVESEPGIGTEFKIELPYELVQLSPSEVLKQEQEAPTKQKRLSVLVCEDNVLNQRLAKVVLRNMGHEVTVAENGQEGFEHLQRASFDLVLMDLQMPVLDGYACTRKIREELKLNVPILAMTAHSMVGEKEKCLEVGMNEYIPKPFRQEELFQKIQQLTHAGEGQRQAEEVKVPEQQQAVLNLTYLMELSMGNPDFQREMIGTFRKQTPEELDRMQRACKAEQWDEVKRVAHKLKSSLYIVGAEHLIALFAEIEAAPMQMKKKKQFALIEKGMEEVNAQLDAYLLNLG